MCGCRGRRKRSSLGPLSPLQSGPAAEHPFFCFGSWSSSNSLAAPRVSAGNYALEFVWTTCWTMASPFESVPQPQPPAFESLHLDSSYSAPFSWKAGAVVAGPPSSSLMGPETPAAGPPSHIFSGTSARLLPRPPSSASGERTPRFPLRTATDVPTVSISGNEESSGPQVNLSHVDQSLPFVLHRRLSASSSALLQTACSVESITGLVAIAVSALDGAARSTSLHVFNPFFAHVVVDVTLPPLLLDSRRLVFVSFPDRDHGDDAVPGAATNPASYSCLVSLCDPTGVLVIVHFRIADRNCCEAVLSETIDVGIDRKLFSSASEVVACLSLCAAKRTLLVGGSAGSLFAVHLDSLDVTVISEIDRSPQNVLGIPGSSISSSSSSVSRPSASMSAGKIVSSVLGWLSGGASTSKRRKTSVSGSRMCRIIPRQDQVTGLCLTLSHLELWDFGSGLCKWVFPVRSVLQKHVIAPPGSDLDADDWRVVPVDICSVPDGCLLLVAYRPETSGGLQEHQEREHAEGEEDEWAFLVAHFALDSETCALDCASLLEVDAAIRGNLFRDDLPLQILLSEPLNAFACLIGATWLTFFSLQELLDKSSQNSLVGVRAPIEAMLCCALQPSLPFAVDSLRQSTGFVIMSSRKGLYAAGSPVQEEVHGAAAVLRARDTAQSHRGSPAGQRLTPGPMRATMLGRPTRADVPSAERNVVTAAFWSGAPFHWSSPMDVSSTVLASASRLSSPSFVHLPVATAAFRREDIERAVVDELERISNDTVGLAQMNSWATTPATPAVNDAAATSVVMTDLLRNKFETVSAFVTFLCERSNIWEECLLAAGRASVTQTRDLTEMAWSVRQWITSTPAPASVDSYQELACFYRWELFRRTANSVTRRRRASSSGGSAVVNIIHEWEVHVFGPVSRFLDVLTASVEILGEIILAPPPASGVPVGRQFTQTDRAICILKACSEMWAIAWGQCVHEDSLWLDRQTAIGCIISGLGHLSKAVADVARRPESLAEDPRLLSVIEDVAAVLETYLSVAATPRTQPTAASSVALQTCHDVLMTFIRTCPGLAHALVVKVASRYGDVATLHEALSSEDERLQLAEHDVAFLDYVLLSLSEMRPGTLGKDRLDLCLRSLPVSRCARIAEVLSRHDRHDILWIFFSQHALWLQASESLLYQAASPCSSVSEVRRNRDSACLALLCATALEQPRDATVFRATALVGFLDLHLFALAARIDVGAAAAAAAGPGPEEELFLSVLQWLTPMDGRHLPLSVVGWCLKVILLMLLCRMETDETDEATCLRWLEMVLGAALKATDWTAFETPNVAAEPSGLAAASMVFSVQARSSLYRQTMLYDVLSYQQRQAIFFSSEWLARLGVETDAHRTLLLDVAALVAEDAAAAGTVPQDVPQLPLLPPEVQSCLQ